MKFLRSEFPDVRRLSASALGKLAPLRPPYPAILPVLLSLAEDDPKPQVRQYAVKAIGRYAEFAIDCLDPLKDVARDESAPEYVRTAAAEVVASIQECHRSSVARKNHFCTRCKRIITEPEYRQGMSRWGKPYCRHCYDEKLLEDRNFESMVEDAVEFILETPKGSCSGYVYIGGWWDEFHPYHWCCWSCCGPDCRCDGTCCGCNCGCNNGLLSPTP